MIDEEIVDVVQYIEAPLLDKLRKQTKKELIEHGLVPLILKSRVQQETISELERKLKNEKETLQTKLDKAEAYVEQGRAMITAIMERWYE